ncbi:MAG: hypothetical protein MUC96_19195 [Myxococcaceae bacterium]|jgi:hypothetical protein|nr:hypothetical protein [Myxococcaceae bacterium]
MTAIHVATHHPSTPTALAALGLARALAAAGHHVVVSDGPQRAAIAQALGVDGAGPHEVAPRLVFRSDGEAAAGAVHIIDVGAERGRAADGQLLFVLPAHTDALTALPAAAPAHAGAPWLGLVVWDDGSEPELARLAAHELGADVLGPVQRAAPGELPLDADAEGLARAVSDRLGLVAPAPTSLADLAGLKLQGEAPQAPPASAAQYTFVMEGDALKDAGVVSTAVTTPSKPAPVAAPRGAQGSIEVPPRRFGLAAVVTPWLLVALLAALHLVRS